MITPESDNREISDLQRLLLSTGLMKFTDVTKSGVWGDETQEAVHGLYERLGWDHGADAQWITSSALAAFAAVAATANNTMSSHVGGPGSHASGPGSHAGGPGSHASGPGSHAGGPGSHASGPGSHAGGAGSHAGGPGSHAGGAGSHAG